MKTALLTGLLILLCSGVAAAAPTVVVQNNADSGAGSLRQAILDVDQSGTIVIPAGVGEITLTSGRLVIQKSMTIAGAGATQTVISGGNNSQVFLVLGVPTVTIEGVQIIDGRVDSPGQEVFGGGISQTGGNLTVADSLISQNTLETGSNGFPRGAGIGVKPGARSLTLRNTVVADNLEHGQGSLGGGVYVGGASLTIEGGAVKGNTAEGSTAIGGGLDFHGTQASISHLALTGNELKLAGAAVLGDGGGLAVEGGTGNVLDGLTIARNRATMNDATNKNATVRGAGAAIEATGTTMVNSTITGNIASATVETNGRVIGGGLMLANPTSIVASTIAANTVQAAGISATVGAGGDLGLEPGAALAIRETIVSAGASTSSGANCFEATPGSITSEGGNLDSLDQCRLNAGGDQTNTDPALGTLAENGGPVETMALGPGSPAIDAGGAACPATDARGVLRPASLACDVGAFEVATPSGITEAATGVDTNAATLTGIATNPDLSGGSVFFEYGKTSGLGMRTAAQAIASTTAGGRFAAPVGGLEPGTTYHFREVVTNGAGTAVGTDRTFATAPSPRPITIGALRHPGLTVRHLKGLRFRVHCAGAACVGKLIATTRVGKRIVTVAQAKLRLAPGATKTVTLKPKGAGRRLLAQPGKLPVVVKATLAGNGPRVPKPLRLNLR